MKTRNKVNATYSYFTKKATFTDANDPDDCSVFRGLSREQFEEKCAELLEWQHDVHANITRSNGMSYVVIYTV